MGMLADALVDKLVEKLSDRIETPTDSEPLDSTTLGKNSHLAVPSRGGLATKQMSHQGIASWMPARSQVSSRFRPQAQTEDLTKELVQDLAPELGQKYGPTNPAHEWPKPWTNLQKQEKVQKVKARSGQLKEPLKTDLANDEIFITEDSVHIMKHHGSYMQTNRLLKGIAKKQSYQFMLRLKVPCGEMPGHVFAQIDDLCMKYGQGDLRATTRQAFQMHGVLKGNLKNVISAIANMGSGTLGGCGDISRNVMTPPVQLSNNPAYGYVHQYARALAVLFEPKSDAFSELWLDGKKAITTEYWQRDVGEFNLDQVRVEDRGNGIITGHPSEPLYGRTYLPKKFKIAMTVPGDNSVDIYTNDLGAVVIMEEDGKTLKGFNIMVGGGMGRSHGLEKTKPFAAEHLGFVDKNNFFEAMKAVLAVTRDHGNREMRNQARLKYLVQTLGIDDFRTLTEKYFGQKFEPWVELPEWKYLDWMGWHDQGDGNWMLGVNIEQGRVRDSPEVQVKTALRTIVDTFPGIDLMLTPAQSVVLKNIKPDDKEKVQTILTSHGIKMIEDVDPLTRKSMACPAFPLCGLAITEAERVQPEINLRLWTLLKKMGLGDTEPIVRTTGCPNGCTRPYMAELAFVGSGPGAYQVWLGGHPAQAGRTAFETHLNKMKIADLETSLEPIFDMYKTQRSEGEALGDFFFRVGPDAVKQHSESYAPGKYA
eukprot:gnl/TRDRNA2_/TRDRNA2_174751_c1_seq2.p1 gnl/TRDRNA2_/TRDRNA2_174751_c1~~gnl/TRDRNA2_/TRDRNA2_174751_c1_seq2.p1  ORF type:complete len:713 (+),score=133.62 gnl/TRDRNA2_/TRDRNA2_174751_c1_seq2:26-2140(+)